MPAFRRVLLVLAALLLAATATAVSALHAGAQGASGGAGQATVQAQPQRDETELPAVDYDSPEPSNPQEAAERKKRNARYDNNFLVRKEDATGTAVAATFFSEWGWGGPALPAGRSELIAVGDVIGVRAHLSNDKTNIYSEFTTRVTQVLKNDGPARLAAGDVIDLERQGGAVRYPNGRKYPYRISGQNMPRSGRRYLFFVKAAGAEQGFRLLTAYELKEGKVFPLDSAQQFDAFRGTEESKFMEAVRGAIGRNQD